MYPDVTFVSRKRKCSRRSSSFSSFEEVVWKKEIAVSCLMSAAETKADYQETESAIQQVVDELYSKLSRLNLTSGKIYDVESSLSSQTYCLTNQQTGRAINEPIS